MKKTIEETEMGKSLLVLIGSESLNDVSTP